MFLSSMAYTYIAVTFQLRSSINVRLTSSSFYNGVCTRWRKYSGPCVMQVLRKFRSCSVHVAPLETAGIFNVEMIP